MRKILFSLLAPEYHYLANIQKWEFNTANLDQLIYITISNGKSVKARTIYKDTIKFF
ncbi:hypothetical protein [Chryseobacterium sp. JV558]|uniref:hypothetical protein n=1 Tax=Chryseobacterium sp. JV558 TaxID=2663236 RepID=UPI00299D6302|nr:hypothetical protein [Chryseobacterium sp. JV558]MDW9379852.1 hypothetical protein [Chryseobacterium sp. JV558]